MPTPSAPLPQPKAQPTATDVVDAALFSTKVVAIACSVAAGVGALVAWSLGYSHFGAASDPLSWFGLTADIGIAAFLAITSWQLAGPGTDPDLGLE